MESGNGRSCKLIQNDGLTVNKFLSGVIAREID